MWSIIFIMYLDYGFDWGLALGLGAGGTLGFFYLPTSFSGSMRTGYFLFKEDFISFISFISLISLISSLFIGFLAVFFIS